MNATIVNKRTVRPIAGALAIIAARNWGLTAIAELDLVAEVFGSGFGETDTATRIIDGSVGLASAGAHALRSTVTRKSSSALKGRRSHVPSSRSINKPDASASARYSSNE
jgi:uncharacterized membrane protein YuzA (DUF378 family)